MIHLGILNLSTVKLNQLTDYLPKNQECIQT